MSTEQDPTETPIEMPIGERIYEPESDEEKLIVDLFVNEKDLSKLAEKLAEFSTVTKLENYRSVGSPAIQLARIVEALKREDEARKAEIVQLNKQLEEHENGEELTRVRGFWREAEIEQGKAYALLTGLFESLTFDMNPRLLVVEKSVMQRLETDHGADFRFLFDKLFGRESGEVAPRAPSRLESENRALRRAFELLLIAVRPEAVGTLAFPVETLEVLSDDRFVQDIVKSFRNKS
jgi:hypothetical protein